ncbi:MAG: hypothetical protein ABJZ55_07620 [Fuerstiella sp.]
MIPTECDCQADTIVSPLNIECLERNERGRTADYPHMTYDPAYVSYVQKNHGGVPKRQWFKTEEGQVLRLGRFINFGGPYNDPYQDNWESPGRDIRDSWSIDTLKSIANIADGCGAFLVPFGLLYAGPHRPEEMQNVHLDLVCFDYSDQCAAVPTVVAWNNNAAVDESYDCEDEGRDTWTEMRHDRFTHRVAGNFTDFMLTLCESESDVKNVS